MVIENTVSRFHYEYISLPDNSEINLWRDAQWMMRLQVKNNKAKVDLENDSDSGIPTIKAGQVVQIK